jgi:hypothetical protein
MRKTWKTNWPSESVLNFPHDRHLNDIPPSFHFRLFRDTSLDLPAYSQAHRHVYADVVADFKTKTSFATNEMREEYLSNLQDLSQQHMLVRRDVVPGKPRANSITSYREVSDRKASPPRMRAPSVTSPDLMGSTHTTLPRLSRVGTNEWDIEANSGNGKKSGCVCTCSLS